MNLYKMIARIRYSPRAFKNALGPNTIGNGQPKWGIWCITNFLWNTLPFDNRGGKRWYYQLRLRNFLLPYINPERNIHRSN